MSDLSDSISRQQTITALRALSDGDGYINAPHEVVTDVVRGLPPVRAEHEQTTQPEQGESDKLASKMGGTWVDVTCPNCGCEIHVESAQPNLQPTCNQLATDCISRQAVLDYIDNMPSELTADGRRMIRRIRLTEYIQDSLPSVQPEVIRCKECEWFRKEYGWNCIEYTVCGVSPTHHPIRREDDFCSYAECEEASG